MNSNEAELNRQVQEKNQRMYTQNTEFIIIYVERIMCCVRCKRNRGGKIEEAAAQKEKEEPVTSVQRV